MEDNRISHNRNKARYGGQQSQPQREQSSLRETTTTETELATKDDHNGNRARYGGQQSQPQREQSSLRGTTTTETELATEDNHNGNRARYGGQPQREQSSLRRTTTELVRDTSLLRPVRQVIYYDILRLFRNLLPNVSKFGARRSSNDEVYQPSTVRVRRSHCQARELC